MTQIDPLQVHVVADSTKSPAAPKPARRRNVRYSTVTLTEAAPVATIAGTEPLRDQLIVRASGNDVWITDSLPNAQAAAGGDTGQAYPVLATDATPTRWESTEAVYAAAAAYPATLGVIIIQREAS